MFSFFFIHVLPFDRILLFFSSLVFFCSLRLINSVTPGTLGEIDERKLKQQPLEWICKFSIELKKNKRKEKCLITDYRLPEIGIRIRDVISTEVKYTGFGYFYLQKINVFMPRERAPSPLHMNICDDTAYARTVAWEAVPGHWPLAWRALCRED